MKKLTIVSFLFAFLIGGYLQVSAKDEKISFRNLDYQEVRYQATSSAPMSAPSGGGSCG